MGIKRDRAPGLWALHSLYIVVGDTLYIGEMRGFWGEYIINGINISNMIYKMRGDFHFPGIFVAFYLWSGLKYIKYEIFMVIFGVFWGCKVYILEYIRGWRPILINNPSIV